MTTTNAVVRHAAGTRILGGAHSIMLVNPPGFRVACKELGDYRCNEIKKVVAHSRVGLVFCQRPDEPRM